MCGCVGRFSCFVLYESIWDWVSQRVRVIGGLRDVKCNVGRLG